jgi:hypothetical protein
MKEKKGKEMKEEMNGKKGKERKGNEKERK